MEEGSINVKALRAKFQEEALLAQAKSGRPAVAEKPKHLTPSGGHCSSVVSSINMAVVNNTAVVPRVIFRDGLRASGGKRPISFPPQPQRTSPTCHGHENCAARQSLVDRHMPLVLPVPPVKEQGAELPLRREPKQESEPGSEAAPQTKIKKKGLLLPFMSSKATKGSGENGEDPTYVDLTTRPSSAPADLPSGEKQSTDDMASLQSDQLASDTALASPEFPITSPPVKSSFESDNKMISTLERAKKKFSYKHMLLSAKPKALRSPDYASRDKTFLSPPKNIDSEAKAPSPVGLPHLACISARPFFKVDSSATKSALDKHFGKGKAKPTPSNAGAHPHPPSVPPKKPLPEFTSIRSAPLKPSRPPAVDLSCYHPSSGNGSPPNSQTPSEEPDSEQTSPVLDAPEFPDFDNPEIETEAVDLATLNLEALDLVSSELPVPGGLTVAGFEDPLPALPSCDPGKALLSTTIQDLDLENRISFDPVGFSEPINISEFPPPPAPEQWFQSEEVSIDPQRIPQADEADLGTTTFHSSGQEVDSGNPVSLEDGAQSHSSLPLQDSYYEACDNVYEDVENVNKIIPSQNSRKRKVGLKNPYAESHSSQPAKEEGGHKWHRNPWYVTESRISPEALAKCNDGEKFSPLVHPLPGQFQCRSSAAGEQAHPAHIHVLGKDRQSPNTAEYKEQKKREKQRLEREKKEQKERERKDNEMKKKFKVTGEEEPMYHAKVVLTRKLRKNDLPVKSGDTVGIIRTTSCPKGKWLAKDWNNKYGYISVMNVELNIKEMLELGKKAKAVGRGANVEADTISIGSRSSSHPVLTSSFTDDSEEWACEDETLSLSNESHNFSRQAALIPEMSCGHASAQHTLSDANLEELHTQTRHEALQKLAIFFQHNKEEFGDASEGGGATPTNADPPSFLCAVEEPPYPEQGIDFTGLGLLPPPPLYADT